MKKKKKILKLNPVEEGLTEAEYNVFKVLEKRQVRGKVTSTGDISKALRGLDRSWIWRNLMSLIEKGIVEQYSRRCYRII